MGYSVWSPYSGLESYLLSAGMVLAAVVLVLLGMRIRRPLAARPAGRLVGSFLILIWLLSVVIMSVVTIAYGLAIYQQAGRMPVPTNPITRYTIGFAVLAFGCVLVLTRTYGWKLALVSAIAAAGAGPAMFEVPFDLVIAFRLQVPDPAGVYRLLYFVPLLLFNVATLALLTLSPAARLRRQTLFALAGMFAVWAVWALLGFAYPATVATTTLNVASKLLSAVAGVLIFLPDRRERRPDRHEGPPAPPADTAANSTAQRVPE